MPGSNDTPTRLVEPASARAAGVMFINGPLREHISAPKVNNPTAQSGTESVLAMPARSSGDLLYFPPA